MKEEELFPDGKYVEDYDNLMNDAGHTTQAIGRMMQSRLGLSEEDHKDLIIALQKITDIIRICRNLEFEDVVPLTKNELAGLLSE